MSKVFVIPDVHLKPWIFDKAEELLSQNEYDKGLFDAVRIKREAANVFDDVLQEDVVFSSPTGPAVFALGCSANGWTTWKTDNGEAIDKYRDH